MSTIKLVDYLLHGIEADLSKVTNGGKASDAAWKRIVDRCDEAADKLITARV